MNHPLRAVLAIGLAGLLAGVAHAGPSFGTVVDHLDLRENTKLHSQEYFKGVKGQSVTWSGEVVDVKGGRNRARIFVADRSRQLFRGYNITLVTHDLGRAAKIRKGQHLRFTGRLHSYNAKSGGAVVDLADVDLR